MILFESHRHPGKSVLFFPSCRWESQDTFSHGHTARKHRAMLETLASSSPCHALPPLFKQRPSRAQSQGAKRCKLSVLTSYTGQERRKHINFKSHPWNCQEAGTVISLCFCFTLPRMAVWRSQGVETGKSKPTWPAGGNLHRQRTDTGERSIVGGNPAQLSVRDSVQVLLTLPFNRQLSLRFWNKKEGKETEFPFSFVTVSILWS